MDPFENDSSLLDRGKAKNTLMVKEVAKDHSSEHFPKCLPGDVTMCYTHYKRKALKTGINEVKPCVVYAC